MKATVIYGDIIVNSDKDIELVSGTINSDNYGSVMIELTNENRSGSYTLHIPKNKIKEDTIRLTMDLYDSDNNRYNGYIDVKIVDELICQNFIIDNIHKVDKESLYENN